MFGSRKSQRDATKYTELSTASSDFSLESEGADLQGDRQIKTQDDAAAQQPAWLDNAQLLLSFAVQVYYPSLFVFGANGLGTVFSSHGTEERQQC